MDFIRETESKKTTVTSPKVVEKNTSKCPPVSSLSACDQEEKRKKFKIALEKAEKKASAASSGALDLEELPTDQIVSPPVQPFFLFDLFTHNTPENDTEENTIETINNKKIDNAELSSLPLEMRVLREDKDFLLSNNEHGPFAHEGLRDSQDQGGIHHSPYTAVYNVSPVEVMDGQMGQGNNSTRFSGSTVTTDIPEVLVDIVTELTQSLTVLYASDRTEIEVTLQHPPIFRGVALHVTELKTSQKEFQLTFLNVTNPEARALIELPRHQELLRAALVEKGYQLQMITIEPKLYLNTAVVQAENTTYDEQGQRDREGQEQGDEQQG